MKGGPYGPPFFVAALAITGPMFIWGGLFIDPIETNARMSSSPFIPPEWAPHAALWTAFPSNPDLWEEDLVPAQAEVAAMARALAAPYGDRHGDHVILLADGAPAIAAAQAAVGDRATIWAQAFGDIWLRDTGPIFAVQDGALRAQGFRFNGWGAKYLLPDDDDLAERLAAKAQTPFDSHDFVLEGGAIELNGAGIALTTRQCLLNPNRNPGWTSDAAAETALRAALGITEVIWLDEGLANDHTDGHIDNLARFIASDVILCQSPAPGDPNADILRAIEDRLRAARDGSGRPFHIITIPSPGLVEDADGDPAPASHMNFIIGNASVIVPIYETPSSAGAIAALAPLFPGRRVIGLPARFLLTGGGAFHCITQQQPALLAP